LAQSLLLPSGTAGNGGRQHGADESLMPKPCTDDKGTGQRSTFLKGGKLKRRKN